MTATDELRRLLDERGVEWSDYSDDRVVHTTWSNVNYMNCWFNEFPDGWTAWGMSMHGTPMQAIAATLGAGTCRNIDDDYDSYFECSECGCHVLCEFYGSGYGEPRFCPGCGRRVKG